VLGAGGGFAAFVLLIGMVVARRVVPATMLGVEGSSARSARRASGWRPRAAS
jgi:hypothetical protein